jgi:hypothetical protein
LFGSAKVALILIFAKKYPHLSYLCAKLNKLIWQLQLILKTDFVLILMANHAQ